MTDHMGGIVPPTTKASRKRRRRRRIGLLAAVVVLITGAVWVTTVAIRSCGSLGSGVYEVDGECVGITDGSYVFHPELADVERRIAKENDRVRTASASYVTVALLDPFTPVAMNALPAEAVRNRLEGAYTALRRVNSTRVVGDPEPQIQLVLASAGSTDDQWQRVIAKLVEMSAQQANPLVAVIGLGVSTEQTQRRAKELSEHGIPMVGALLTADVLAYDHIPGLIKTSPSNRDYVKALRRYLDSTDLRPAILVRDANSDLNSDFGRDLFTQGLENQFEKQMGDLIGFASQQFTGKAIPGNADPDLFATASTNICASAANGLRIVLYAGRELDLVGFLESLGHRSCNRTPLTILAAGTDLGAILEGREQELRAANPTVVFAGTVDAEGWGQNAPGTPEHYGDFLSVFQSQGFDSGHLGDGGAIMMHDALLTAAKAVRLAAPRGSASSPTAGDVRGQMLNLNGNFEVPGASGGSSFSADSPGAGSPLDKSGCRLTNTGDVVGKPVPVLQYPHPKPADSPSRQVGSLYCVTD